MSVFAVMMMRITMCASINTCCRKWLPRYQGELQKYQKCLFISVSPTVCVENGWHMRVVMAGRQLIVPVRWSAVGKRPVIVRCSRPEVTMALVVMVTGIEVHIVLVMELMAGTTVVPEITTKRLAVAHFIMVLIEMVIMVVMVVIMRIVVIVEKVPVMRIRRRVSNHTEMIATATSMAVTGTRTSAKIT